MITILQKCYRCYINRVKRPTGHPAEDGTHAIASFSEWRLNGEVGKEEISIAD
jgi:hypothetical protein